MDIRTFLKGAKEKMEKHSSGDVFLVIGNESCDLDSTVSALCYAIFKEYTSKKEKGKQNTIAVPVLNVKKLLFPIKTESYYFLKDRNVDCESLIFIDEINFDELTRNKAVKIVLVDHHVMCSTLQHFTNFVVEIIDHRPLDTTVSWPNNVKIMHGETGSCSTLIAEKILTLDVPVDPAIGFLLYGTIILDTINFNESAKKFVPLDVEISQKLKSRFNITEDAKHLFDRLCAARSDISKLTPLQILHKDLKIIGDTAIPGVPMLAKEFLLKYPEWEQIFEKFMKELNVVIVILMGLKAQDSTVSRDLAIYSKNDTLKSKIIDKLLTSKIPDLKLVKQPFDGINLFIQNNVHASRKQIIPILKS